MSRYETCPKDHWPRTLILVHFLHLVQTADHVMDRARCTPNTQQPNASMQSDSVGHDAHDLGRRARANQNVLDSLIIVLSRIELVVDRAQADKYSMYKKA